MKNKKIIIAGGTGFIGRNLARYFAVENEVVILSRNIISSTNNAYEEFNTPPEHVENVRIIQWNGRDLGDWATEIDGADLVINLAGKSVNCRYNVRNKREIFDSRVLATKVIGQAINIAANPPQLWINAASATIYRHANDRPQDEYTGEVHSDFSVQVCKLWEQTFFESETPLTRKIAFRTAITLGVGGVMIPYFNLLKFGLGGHQGSGKQMYSWVHIEDVCRAIDFVSDYKQLEGVYNLSAPNPVSNKCFMATLRKVTGTSVGLPAFSWMLAIGAAVIGTEAELILKSRWVIPTKLLEAGFVFKYPFLKEAIENIVANTKRKKYNFF